MDAAEPTFPEIKAVFDRDPLILCGRIPGLWLVDKPPGPTSHDVVARMRRALNLRRVGHAGTLDPMASGLLVVMAGNASRLFDSIQTFPKTYIADFRLGDRTDSQDASGQPLAGWTPSRFSLPSGEEVAAALATFEGVVMQVPPMHSALKRNGVPLYKLARIGETVEREARPVAAQRLELAEFTAAGRGRIELTVSSGFYVRTLIDDLGTRLGCGAVMTNLRRTTIGPFGVENATPLSAFMDGPVR